MKNYVLDSHALLAYCEGEKGAAFVAGLFKEALGQKARLLLSVINWGEVYYIALREGGKTRAELYRATIEKYPIEILAADQVLTLQAAQYKAHHKMSYADAFAAALAAKNKAILVTGDPEFKPLAKEIAIHWIR